MTDNASDRAHLDVLRALEGARAAHQNALLKACEAARDVRKAEQWLESAKAEANAAMAA